MDARSEFRFLFQYVEQTKCHLHFAMSQIINNKEGALIYVKLYPAVRYPFKSTEFTAFGRVLAKSANSVPVNIHIAKRPFAMSKLS